MKLSSDQFVPEDPFSLRITMALFLVSFLILFCGVFYTYSIYRTRSEMIAQQQSAVDSGLRHHLDHIRDSLRARAVILQDYAALPLVVDAVMHPVQDLSKRTDFLHSISILEGKPPLMLLDFRGRTITTANTDERVDFSALGWTRELLAGSSPERTCLCTRQGKKFWQVAVPVRYYGSIEGVLVAEFKAPAHFCDHLAPGHALAVLTGGHEVASCGAPPANALTRELQQPDLNAVFRYSIDISRITDHYRAQLVRLGGFIGLTAMLFLAVFYVIGKNIFVVPQQKLQELTTELETANHRLTREIDEHRRAEESLSCQTGLLETVLANIPLSVFWKDRDSVYLGCNREFAVWAALENPLHIVGKNDHDLPWETAEADSSRRSDRKVLGSDQPLREIEEKLTLSDGRQRTIITSKVPLKDTDGTVFGVLGIFYDITERRQMEEMIRQNQKMEAIGTLAGGIAHDFNNILGGIIGYVELARDDTPADSPVQEYLSGMLTSATRARDLVKHILAFSRQTREERRPVDLAAIAREATRLLRATIPTTIHIVVETEADAGMVCADPTQMHQIVMNLCANAAQAMQLEPGELRLRVAPVALTPQTAPRNSNMPAGPYVQLTVIDTGPGIPPGIVHRIFDPFFTTKEQGSGTGMGLAVVHGIVRDHGGEITVESRPGQGTAFTVLLPQVVAEADDEVSDRQQAVTGGTGHVLFVDDEKTLIDLGKRMLESLGYTVSAYNSSLAALEAFQRAPERFDLVITDQTMPNMTGFSLASRILEITPVVPIVLCTGYSDSVTPESARAAGVCTLLYKPIRKKDLAMAVRAALDGKRRVPGIA